MSEFGLSANEKIITRYPWYSIGYLDIYEYICNQDRESSDIYLQRAALRVYSREKLYHIYNSVIENGAIDLVAEAKPKVTLDTVSTSHNLEEIVLEEIIDFVPENMPRFVLAGGDYFSRKDFDLVELDKSKPLDNFIAEKPTLLRSIVKGERAESSPINEIDTSELFDDASFYTETLASIYTEQGLHKRALDVYAKLILLYPEKSSYFATLVKGLKEKHKI